MELSRELLVDDTILWQDKRIVLAPPFKRVKFMEIIGEKSG